MGYADVTGLLMLKPSVGEHVIKCGEFGNVDGNITEGGELTLYVSSGTRETLVVQTAQQANDTTYASSLGAVDVDTFSMYASSDHIVPLDIFSIRVADGGGNYLSGALPAYNSTETNMLQDVRIVSAALHGESLSGFYPYITRESTGGWLEAKCSSAIRCIRSRPMMMASLSRCRTLIIRHLLNLWHCIALLSELSHWRSMLHRMLC